jgi:hypothetical protein
MSSVLWLWSASANCSRARICSPRSRLAYDELELWLLYLSESLAFERVRASTIIVIDRVSRLDDHLVLGHGRAPEMKLTKTVRRALRSEASSGRPGWLARSERLIADIQQQRPPKHWRTDRVHGLAICAPADPRARPRRISDIPVTWRTPLGG